MPYARIPTNTDEVVFVQGLVREVPALAPALQEHIEFNKELLPYLFMGDVGRFVIANASRPDSKSTLVRLVAYLEKGLANGPEEVQELIVVSFVEYLQDEAPAIIAIAPLLGPLLKKSINTICGYCLPGGMI